MKFVNQPVPKKDATALVTGKPVYTQDIAPKNCLVVQLLRSPHAHALIKTIDTSIALKVPGVECILTYQDVPQKRFTIAGQSFPEPSPYDRLILDRRLRFVGDPVAIIAAETEAAAQKAMRLIRVSYEILEPLLDFRVAKDNAILVHPEDDVTINSFFNTDISRNLVATDRFTHGNPEKAFAMCSHIIDQVYHTKANNQTMMETFRTFTQMDAYGRLICTSATQIPFHVRRILSTALDIKKAQVRVIKPRIGGGFGAKQTAVSEIYPAIVTWKTGKPAMLIYTREESFLAGSPRHEMEIHVRLGSDDQGNMKAISVYTLSNTGSYGEHGPTTVGLSGHKTIPIYQTIKDFTFDYDVVYTNTVPAGAYRGYGATQGFFAVESAVNELAAVLNMDPTILRMKNLVKQGDVMAAYYGETLNSCTLDRCIDKAKEMIHWEEKYPARTMENGKIRSVGFAVAMQGSGISAIDTAAAEIRLNDDGFYTLLIGASDMGTGCDTILAQMAADCLDTHVDNIVVHGVDTDTSPYDTGSYASSTTYVTGMAVVKSCERLLEKMKLKAAELLSAQLVDFDGTHFFTVDHEKTISLAQLGNSAFCDNNLALSASEHFTSPVSPPPFMAGAVEIELDPQTGEVAVLDYACAVDCGTVINTNLARVQTEGGIVQGIGMALHEDVVYDTKGRMITDSFMQYKIPSRLDVGTIQVAFESSYEPTGPFGAKSVGELVINTPCPALANAVYHASGVFVRTLPITAEKIVMGMKK